MCVLTCTFLNPTPNTVLTGDSITLFTDVRACIPDLLSMGVTCLQTIWYICIVDDRYSTREPWNKLNELYTTSSCSNLLKVTQTCNSYNVGWCAKFSRMSTYTCNIYKDCHNINLKILKILKFRAAFPRKGTELLFPLSVYIFRRLSISSFNWLVDILYYMHPYDNWSKGLLINFCKPKRYTYSSCFNTKGTTILGFDSKWLISIVCCPGLIVSYQNCKLWSSLLKYLHIYTWHHVRFKNSLHKDGRNFNCICLLVQRASPVQPLSRHVRVKPALPYLQV